MKDPVLGFLEGAVEAVVNNIITQSPYLARQHIQALVERIRELEEENAALRLGAHAVRPKAQLPATVEPEPPTRRPKPPGDPWAVASEPEATPHDKAVKDGRYR